MHNDKPPVPPLVFGIHDLRDFSMRDAYDVTQTSDMIKSGDVLLVEDGIAVLDCAWPVMVIGKSQTFHHLKNNISWEDLASRGQSYLAQVAYINTTPFADLVALSSKTE